MWSVHCGLIIWEHFAILNKNKSHGVFFYYFLNAKCPGYVYKLHYIDWTCLFTPLFHSVRDLLYMEVVFFYVFCLFFFFQVKTVCLSLLPSQTIPSQDQTFDSSQNFGVAASVTAAQQQGLGGKIRIILTVFFTIFLRLTNTTFFRVSGLSCLSSSCCMKCDQM